MTSPKTHFDLVKNLNQKQKYTVTEIGFGSILLLNMKRLPLRLAKYLVERFNAPKTYPFQPGRRVSPHG